MADAVTISGSPDADLAWNEAGDWLWSDAVPTWDSNNPRTVDCAVAADYAVAEARASLADRTTGRDLALSMTAVRDMVDWEQRSLSFAETRIDLINFIFAVTEAMTLAEGTTRGTDQPVGEAFDIGDAKFVETLKAIARSLEATDTMSTTSNFIRDEAVSMFVLDMLRKDILNHEQRAVGVTEEYIRNSQGVLQDYLLKNRGLTLAEIEEMVGAKTPVFHEQFQDLIAGDYVFQSAIIGLFVASRQASIRPAISEFILTIDMPDVVDSGVEELPAATTLITFNKAFYTPPEVNCDLMEGLELAVPRIGIISTTGFEVTLRNSSGVAVAGEISWTAKGR